MRTHSQSERSRCYDGDTQGGVGTQGACPGGSETAFWKKVSLLGQERRGEEGEECIPGRSHTGKVRRPGGLPPLGMMDQRGRSGAGVREEENHPGRASSGGVQARAGLFHVGQEPDGFSQGTLARSSAEPVLSSLGRGSHGLSWVPVRGYGAQDRLPTTRNCLDTGVGWPTPRSSGPRPRQPQKVPRPGRGRAGRWVYQKVAVSARGGQGSGEGGAGDWWHLHHHMAPAECWCGGAAQVPHP